MDYAAQTLSAIWRNRPRYRTVLLFQLSVALLLLTFSFFASPETSEDSTRLVKRGGSFGGFDTRPQDVRCYKQERVATLFSVFLGVFGADHWYAR